MARLAVIACTAAAVVHSTGAITTRLAQAPADLERTNLARVSGRQVLSSVDRYPMGLHTLQWIEEQAQEISLDNTSYNGSMNATAIVTHAGKDYLDYIDAATMLGLALERHAPGVPRFAMVIKAMVDKYKQQLKSVGWHIVEVEDWGNEHCGGNCASNFLGRWGDSFEKINVWRFPFERVLFLDSDMYVFSDEINDILNTQIGPNQIAMTPDGCKPEHNSGMLLFRPDLGVFSRLMQQIALHQNGGREVLDQTIINLEYHGSIVSMHKKYNCIDYSADKHCILHCGEDTVVAHFTGTPKPTRQSTWNLERVRALNGSAACMGTNLGCCGMWPLYFCEMKRNLHMLSFRLQLALNKTGPCMLEPELAAPEGAVAMAEDEAVRFIGD